ncbi:MAG: ABC transporter substrate-binding protein [Chloroflexi bacterium]|nr:ABC transporter substrate-binding protein [Chloroflexota bacterium]
MRARKLFGFESCAAILAMLLASCAPASGPAPAAKTVAPTAVTTTTTAPTSGAAGPGATPKPSAEQPRYGGTLTVSTFFEPPHLDLHQGQLMATRVAAIPAYDTLLQYNPLKQDEIIPDLAERYEMSRDGLSYTFYLNKGVKFHDGASLTAEDVKYNLDRLRAPPRGVLSPRAALLASIDRIETPDAGTVRIITKYPDASLLGGLALSHHVIYPKKVVEEKGDMKKTVVGTGPFKFVRYETGVVVEHTKNKEYFRKERPFLDGLVFYIMTDSATRFAAFRTGRVLMTAQGSGGLSPIQAELTEKELKGKARPLRYVSMSNTFALINVSRKPLDDVRVRRALNLLTDRPSIIKVAWAGEGMLSVFFLPEPYGKWEFPNAEILKLPGYRPDKAADIDEAKKLLAEAGYGGGLSLTLAVRTIPQHVRTGEMLREQYKAAAIDLKLETLETAVWSERKLKENYELLLDVWSVDADDPTAWLGNILTPGISFKDDQLDEWTKEQARILDFQARKGLVRTIHLRLFELLPVVPSLKGATYAMGVWDRVKNYPEPIGTWNSHKYTEVWLAN